MKRLNECGCGCGGSAGGCQKPEGSMAKHDAMECASDAQAVSDMISEADDLPEWLESKITLAADYMNRVKDYLTHHMNKQGTMPGFGGNVSSNAQPQFVPVTLDTPEKMKGFIREIIRKVGSQYELVSHSRKTLGKGTKGEMEKRETQVNYFKNKK